MAWQVVILFTNQWYAIGGIVAPEAQLPPTSLLCNVCGLRRQKSNPGLPADKRNPIPEPPAAVSPNPHEQASAAQPELAFTMGCVHLRKQIKCPLLPTGPDSLCVLGIQYLRWTPMWGSAHHVLFHIPLKSLTLMRPPTCRQ